MDLQPTRSDCRSGFVEVPGARLYHEIRGDGPPLVLITGAAGSVEPYRMLAAQLAPQFTVVAYDRRGFSRSVLTGDQDYGRRLETDADDVAALIRHLGRGPAAVFGNSSGGTVALEVLVRHAPLVSRVVAHEPPVMRELREAEAWAALFASLYATYRESGPVAAMERFRERSFPESDREVMARVPVNEFSAPNAVYWFEHELRQYPMTVFDHRCLRREAERLVLAVGRDSCGYPCREATLALGLRLACPVQEFPGGHVGFVAGAPQFAHHLSAALEPAGADTHGPSGVVTTTG